MAGSRDESGVSEEDDDSERSSHHGSDMDNIDSDNDEVHKDKIKYENHPKVNYLWFMGWLHFCLIGKTVNVLKFVKN